MCLFGRMHGVTRQCKDDSHDGTTFILRLFINAVKSRLRAVRSKLKDIVEQLDSDSPLSFACSIFLFFATRWRLSIFFLPVKAPYLWRDELHR